jgi:hypothetical protein
MIYHLSLFLNLVFYLCLYTSLQSVICLCLFFWLHHREAGSFHFSHEALITLLLFCVTCVGERSLTYTERQER